MLKQEDGITFKELFAAQEEEPPAEVVEGAEPSTEEKLPKYIERKEVVRENNMHFFTVPKLGSYLAVKMEFQSCLFEDAFNSALGDLIEVKTKQDAQDAERRAWDTE